MVLGKGLAPFSLGYDVSLGLKEFKRIIKVIIRVNGILYLRVSKSFLSGLNYDQENENVL